jgi:hypothetical protein
MAQIVSGDSTLVLKVAAAPANSAAVTMYGLDGRVVATQSKATYSASASFTPVATPTDLIMITGSATKIIRVVSLYVTTLNTAGGGSGTVFVLKRGVLNQGGTFVSATKVPHDSTDAASVATAGHYTANPTTLGVTIATVNSVRMVIPATTPTSPGSNVEEAGIEFLPWSGGTFIDKLLTLNNVNESIVVNFNSVALLTGQVHDYRITWTEE